ncbi:MAG TPA: BglII/BstYI family type II restriction endonuclease [Bacillota bacterium]|nr:BglII/BstYI family type II restriction endonuclease [Bacillota bacterium]
MYIAGIYSFNKGEEAVKSKYPHLLKEIELVIEAVNAEEHKIKRSKEKTMTGKILYSPRSLNKAFKKEFSKYGWKSHKEKCDYPTQYYTKQHNYNFNLTAKGAFREMDFVKEHLGVEVQFGKYAFMVYNVCAKMTIFTKKGIIDVGVEIVPIKVFADEMSTGVSFFEQFVWDLEHRGTSNIDIPVLILGVNSNSYL